MKLSIISLMKQTLKATALATALAVSLPAITSAANGYVQYVAYFSSNQEVNGVDASTPAEVGGMGHFTFIESENILEFDIHYSNLSGGLVNSHFHNAAVGVNNGPFQTICGNPSPALLGACPAANADNSGDLRGRIRLTSAEVEELKQARIYVNLHTALNGGGEIRGQILRCSDAKLKH